MPVILLTFILMQNTIIDKKYILVEWKSKIAKEREKNYENMEYIQSQGTWRNVLRRG